MPFDTFEAEMITPKEHVKTGIILYLHGGGYTAGSLKYANGFGSVLANRMNLRVLCVALSVCAGASFSGGVRGCLCSLSLFIAGGLFSG